MVRKTVRFSGRLLMSAAISWALIPIANAEAPSEAGTPKPEISSVAEDAPSEPATKQLHTIPEDGIGDTKWLSGATRIVREITVKRPSEDLIICIAGCVPKQDRVVYAQPTEYVPPKPEIVSDAAPATPDVAPAKAESKTKPAAKPGHAAITPDKKPSSTATNSEATVPVKIPSPMNAGPTPASAEAQPAIAPAAAATAATPVDATPNKAKPDDMKGSEFQPTMSKPKAAAPDAAPAPMFDDAPKAGQPK